MAKKAHEMQVDVRGGVAWGADYAREGGSAPRGRAWVPYRAWLPWKIGRYEDLDKPLVIRTGARGGAARHVDLDRDICAWRRGPWGGGVCYRVIGHDGPCKTQWIAPKETHREWLNARGFQ